MSKTAPDVVYRIDQHDCLVYFNKAWDRFAAANDGASMSSGRVHQQSVWDFIQDPETKHVHQVLVKKVREGDNVKDLPFRCDAPDLRRYMEMDITLLEDSVVEYCCRTIKTEPREPMPVSSPQSNDDSLIRMCSWCKRIDVGTNQWVAVEEAVTRLGLLSKPNLPGFTHTMCDDCMERLERENE